MYHDKSLLNFMSIVMILRVGGGGLEVHTLDDICYTWCKVLIITGERVIVKSEEPRSPSSTTYKFSWKGWNIQNAQWWKYPGVNMGIFEGKYENIRRCLEIFGNHLTCKKYMKVSRNVPNACCVQSANQDNPRIVVCKPRLRTFQGYPQIGCSIPGLYEMKGARYGWMTNPIGLPFSYNPWLHIDVHVCAKVAAIIAILFCILCAHGC